MNLNLYRTGIVSLIIFLSGAVSTSGQITFDEVSSVNSITESYGFGGLGAHFGGGVSCFDYNNDGWDDLTFASKDGDTLYFYENNNGTFQKVVPPLVTNTTEIKQVLWCDYDNDGDNDLLVTAYLQPNKLYRNDGNLNLVDVTNAVGIPTDSDPTYSANWTDFNNDGHVDLYLCNRSTLLTQYSNRLYKNDSLGNFTDVTISANVQGLSHAVFASVVFDFNNDGWPDIYTVDDHHTINSLYKNNGDETFAEVGASSGAGLSMEAMGVTSGDFDNDGYIDLYIANTPPGNKLLMNNGNETFTENADSAGVGFYGLGWGVQAFDFDLDMDLDIYCSGELQPAQGFISSALYENIGNADFLLVTGNGMEADTLKSYGNAIGDFDNNGYPDLAVNNISYIINGDTTISTFQLWENSGGNGNNFLKIKLEGVQSNRNGIGSLIEVYAGGIKQIRYTTCGESYISQNSLSVIFGLGTHALADSVIITWPSGTVDILYNIIGNQKISIIEGSTIASTEPTLYYDITDSSGISHSHGNIPVFGGGLSFVDINNDQLDDIIMSGDVNVPLKTYLNNGDSTFTDAILFTSLTPSTDSKSVIWADIDNDGDQDAFVATNGQQNQLFQNNGGSFTDITVSAGLSNAITWSFAACWGDFNLDGFIDLYVLNSRQGNTNNNIRNYLYKNNGNGTFIDVSVLAGVTDSMNYPLSVSFLDYNNDLWPDIYIAIDRHRGNVLFENNGDDTFTDVSLISGADVELDGMCTAVGDYDNDGDLDVFVTNSFGGPFGLGNGNALIRNNGDGTFTDVADSVGVIGNRTGWGGNFFDFDNDSDLDLFVAYESGDSLNPHKRNSLYENDGSGIFTELDDVGTDADNSRSFGTAIGDLNNDGFYDIAVSNEFTPNRLYLNGANSNNWVKIDLKGRMSNRDGIGSWIEVHLGNNTYYRYTQAGDSYGSQSTFDNIIGLGAATLIDSIIVKWPSGIEDILYNISANKKISILEGTENCDSNNPITVTIGKTNISCNGLNNGAISLSTTGGMSPYSYLWDTDPEQTTSQISGLSANFYHCFITDNNDCLIEKLVEIREPNSLITFFIPDNPTAPGASDGSIDVLVSGGVAPYTYLWSNGFTTEDVANLAAGTYYASIVDNNGCANLIVITLSDGGALKINHQIREAEFDNNCQKLLNVFASGGK
ncbi:MAG: VCBS repeat-containing protein, partial [Bacteroidia bacterium]|nr:VCBS repeat-containing protein [Bacteroidia bacterium]